MTELNVKSSGCEVADNLLSAYIDEELSATESQFVENHVASCEICPKVLEDMEGMLRDLATLPKEAIPEHDLWDDILARCDIEPGVLSIDSARERKKRKFAFTKGQLAAAAVALLMVPGAFAGGMYFGMRADDGPARRDGIVTVVPRRAAPQPDAEPALVTPREPVAPLAPEFPTPPVAPAPTTGGNQAAALTGLIRATRDSDADVRRSAVIAISDMNNAERAIPALSSLVRNDSNDEVRRWAAYALGEIGGTRAIGPLMSALQSDSYPETRRWAAWSLGEISDERAVGALINGLRDSNAEVRRWSAWGLGEIGSPAASGPLTQALDDPNPEVRRWATWALAEVADNF